MASEDPIVFVIFCESEWMFGLRRFSHEGFASVFPAILRKLYLDKFKFPALLSGQRQGVFFRSFHFLFLVMFIIFLFRALTVKL